MVKERLDLWSDFASKAGLRSAPDFREVVEAVRRIPYGRPTHRTAEGLVEEWRGTCSTKHELLDALTRSRWPELDPRIVHRVYRLTPNVAIRLFGDDAATVVPTEGLTDVHTYMTVLIADHRTAIDATVPGPPWDGRSGMTLACGDGTDVEGGSVPRATKERLVREHCDTALRDRVVERLAQLSAPAR